MKKLVINQASEDVLDIVHIEIKENEKRRRWKLSSWEGINYCRKYLSLLTCACIMIIIHKKGDLTHTTNHRSISLLSHLHQLFMKLIAKRLNNKLDFFQLSKRFWFEWSLLVLKIPSEQSLEYNTPLLLVLSDFKKAFNTIEFSRILKALE